MRLFDLKTKTIKAAIPCLTFLFYPGFSYADDNDANLKKMCDRQSLVIAAEFRKNVNDELTAQDMKLVRIGAINACVKTYNRINSSSGFVTSSSVEPTASKDSKEETIEKSSEKESLLDRLLRSEPNDDVSPMQKRHRTGGK